MSSPFAKKRTITVGTDGQAKLRELRSERQRKGDYFELNRVRETGKTCPKKKTLTFDTLTWA